MAGRFRLKNERRSETCDNRGAGLGWIDETTRACRPPLHASSTFIRDPDNQYRSGRIYIRADNPTFDQAEAVLAALEGGAGAMLFVRHGGGDGVFLALKPGDHVVAPKVMYWSLRNWLVTFATEWGLKVELVDMTDLAAVKARGAQGQDQTGLGRDAGQSDLGHHRHRRRRRDRA